MSREALSKAAVNVSLIVFDLDGVLVDTTPCHRGAYESLWNSLDMSGPEYAVIAGRRTVDVVREYAGEHCTNAEDIARLVEFKQAAARALLASEDIVFDDAARTLRRLANCGFSLALGTGASRRGASIALDRLGCAALFKAIVTADDVARGKPDPEVFERACALAGRGPIETLVIEDSSTGVEAALAAGCHAIVVRTDVRDSAERFLGDFRDLDEAADALTASRRVA